MSNSPSGSKPVDITSPRFSSTEQALSGSPRPSIPISGSPTLRALRAQYTGTPPPPNIPSRSTPIGTPRQQAILASASSGPSGVHRPSFGAISPMRPDTPGSGVDLTNPLDDLTDEEKAKILRKHLVSPNERNPVEDDSRRGSMSAGSDSGDISKRSSVAQLRPQRQDSEAFPVPYHAPGADVT